MTMPAASALSHVANEATSSGSTRRLMAASASMIFWITSDSPMPCDLRLVGNLLFHQWRAHIARVDAVAGDAVLCAFQGGDLGQPLQSMLGRDIGTFEGAGSQPVDR